MSGAVQGAVTVAGRGCVAALALALVLHGSTKRPPLRRCTARGACAARTRTGSGSGSGTSHSRSGRGRGRGCRCRRGARRGPRCATAPARSRRRAGRELALGGDYGTVVSNLVREAFTKSDGKNERLWPNLLPLDNEVNFNSNRNFNAGFSAPGLVNFGDDDL